MCGYGIHLRSLGRRRLVLVMCLSHEGSIRQLSLATRLSSLEAQMLPMAKPSVMLQCLMCLLANGQRLKSLMMLTLPRLEVVELIRQQYHTIIRKCWCFFGYTDEKTSAATPQVLVLDMKNWKWASQFLPGGTVAGAGAQGAMTIQAILAFIESNIIIISAFAGAVVLLVISLIIAICIRNRIRRQEDGVFDSRRPLIHPQGPDMPPKAHVQEEGRRSRFTVFSAMQRRSKGGFMWFEEGAGGKSGAKVRKFFGVD